MSDFSASTEIYALIAAAGIGSRVGSDIPKQYHQLAGTSILARSIQRLLSVKAVNNVVVSIAEADIWWPQETVADHPMVTSVTGGASRSASVLEGLKHILNKGAEDSWVLVHDAARPLVRSEDIEQLIVAVSDANACGGILAVPVTDTIKLAFDKNESELSSASKGAVSAEPGSPASDQQHIRSTPERSQLWQAQTPQLFPVKALHDAIASALDADLAITDEASALEVLGHAPILVEGRTDNIKITHAADVALAEHLLSLQT